MSTITVPTTPAPELIDSMCLRFDHAFWARQIIIDDGVLRHETDVEEERRRESLRTTMRQLYAEATGQGFYQGEKIG